MSMATKANDLAKDETVIAKTGKSISQWYAILDEFDGPRKGHKAMADHLAKGYGLDLWYSQNITVGYERERGIRELGQRSDGFFAVDVSKKIEAPVDKVWEAWADPNILGKWFTTNAVHDFREGGAYSNNDGDNGVFKRITPNKMLRFTWENEKHCPGTVVSVAFYPQGDSATRITITHDKLKDRAGMDDMRPGWTWALTSLKSFIETGQPISYENWQASQMDKAAK
jgi:uncharacterized protein YndB with AHSA1/START domain